MRKLRGNYTAWAKVIKNSKIEKMCKKVTEEIDFFGPANFQLILTKKGPVIFEINPRFSGTTPIRAMFGLNEIDLILSEIYKFKIKKNKLKYGTIIRYFEDFYINNKDLIK